MPSLVFRDAEKARDSICIEDQKKIRGLYKEWAEEVGERAKYYEGKTTASSYWQQQQMLELQRQMKAQSAEIHKQIESGAKQSMYTVADSVVGCNAKFLEDLGFSSKDGGLNIAMTSIPTHVVNNIVTGQIYESGWSLSKAIWSDNEKTLADIYEIVAKGRAMNMSAYDVSKMLEGYVNPAKAKMWNLKMADGVRIYKKSVDYNAQRLVRTLNQHAYQQSLIQVAKSNPFIGDIIWHANGSRACPLCIERDGNHYKPEDVPMDHPNGMCTMEPVIDMDETVNQLADWVNSPDGTYPEIDEFAKQFGYVPEIKASVQANNSEQKINSAHYVAQGKDITSTWKRRPEQFDFEIEDVINAQGFDGLPRVVSAKEFDKIAKSNGIICKRGYNVSYETNGANSQEILNSYHNELINGKWYVDCHVGGADYGQGMYSYMKHGIINDTSVMDEAVKLYSGDDGRIEVFTFSKDAKIINSSEIDKLKEATLKDATENAKNTFNELDATSKDIAERMVGLKPSWGKDGNRAIEIFNDMTEEQQSKIQQATSDYNRFVRQETEKYKKMDNGTFAAIKGYDAIKADYDLGENTHEFVILNRTKCIFKGE